MGRLSLVQSVGLLVPFAALTVAAVWAGLAFESLVVAGPALFMASAVFLGLPHGAVDHLVISRLEGEPVMSSTVLGKLAFYVAAAAGVLAVWWFAPVFVFVAFIGLTLFHWGQGDVWFHKRAYSAAPAVSGVLLSGSMPMLVPLLAFPETYAAVAEQFVAATGASVDLTDAVLSARPFAAAALGVFGAVRLTQARGSRIAIAAETFLLALYFSTVPPVAAIAVYFCFWHAPRHLVRLSEQLYGPDLPSFSRTLLASVPLTLVSLLGLAALATAVGPDHLFPTYLALIAALTVPHVAVVTWMDARSYQSILRG